MAFSRSFNEKIPNESNYIFVSSSPIFYADGDGRDKIITITIINTDGTQTIIRKEVKNEWSFIPSSSMGLPYFIKRDVNTNLTIDLNVIENVKNGQLNAITGKPFQMFDALILNRYYGYPTYIGFFEYVWGNSTGDLSSSTQYGYVIYGNSKNTVWQSGLPKAEVGSESIDLGKWLDFVGGMRNEMTYDQLKEDAIEKGLLKNDQYWKAFSYFASIWEKVPKAAEAGIQANERLNPQTTQTPTSESGSVSQKVDQGKKAKPRTITMYRNPTPGEATSSKEDSDRKWKEYKKKNPKSKEKQTTYEYTE